MDKYEYMDIPIIKNKKEIRLIKYELGGKIMKRFVALRPKSSVYVTDDG